MAALETMIQRGEICQCLRAKTMFYQVPEAPGAAESESGSDGPFWCAQTQSLVGPDGEVAGTFNCRPGRPCCETV